MPELYICTSIEVDGPIPGPHSMLSLASAAYDTRQQLVSLFSINLQPLKKAQAHPDTLAHWKSMPEAWAVVTHEPETPHRAMLEYIDWLDHLPAQKVLVAYPAARAFAFIEYYLFKFAGRSPFHKSALDLKSFAMAMLHRPYFQTKKRHMPDAWLFDSPPHTYVALDDAIAVGRLLGHMLDSRATLPRIQSLPDENLPGLIDP
ncbi:MAG: hypothetical protein V3V20_06290 [Algisphaera sp.]